MEIIQLIVLAIGLSMDSLVISLTSGAIISNHKTEYVLKIAGMLAFIQMGLTILGWIIGLRLIRYIDQYDHWFAFGILVFLGFRMIIESLRGNDENAPFNPLNIRVMFSLSVATSIDAMAVGLSLSLLGGNILEPAVIVGAVTFIVSAIGVVFGCKAGRRYNLRINIIGGFILIAIGCTILYEHTLGGVTQSNSLFSSFLSLWQS